MGDIRVGLIGFGFAGETFHAPLLLATDGLRLAAVASSNPTKVHARLGPDVIVTTPEELIARADIDLIVVATPNQLHHPQALAALRAGRHVVVDKPFTLDMVQARELAALAHDRGLLLSVYHNRRWDSDFLTLARVLHEGTLGRVVEFVSHFDRYRPQVRGRWRETATPGSGLWMDLGPHLVDQALRLFGAPSSIALDLAATRDGAVVDDWFHAQLRWSHGPHAGVRARLHASALVAKPNERFAVHGTRGTFLVEGLDPQEDVLKTGPSPADVAGPGWGSDPRIAHLWLGEGDALRHEDVRLLNGSYPSYYAAVRDALRGVGANPVPPSEAIAVQELLDIGLQAARERREITLST
jgi:predicted dehydrogenase